MSKHQIVCVQKNDRFNPHERIKAVGGKNTDGKRWLLSQDEAIEGIESRKWSFFVSAAGRTVDVIVAVSRWGHKYLKTVPDGEQPDNLLSLAECPI
jgi:hypothetical protein